MARLLLLLAFLPTTMACSPLLTALQGSYAPYLAAALLIGVGALALTYFYAKASNDRKLLVAVKDKLALAVTTLAIAAGAEAFTFFLCTAYTTFTGSPVDSLVEESWQVAERYDALVRDYLSTMEKARMGYAALSNVVYSITFFNLFSTPGYLSLPAHPEADVFYNIATVRSSVLINYLLGSVQVHKALLYFLKTLWLEGLFVAAFILRLLPGLREAGDSLLLLYFAIAYLFPFLYAIAGNAFLHLSSPAVVGKVCSDISSKAAGLELPHPFGCRGTGGEFQLGLLSLFTVWMPSLILGVTFQFASAFKRVLAFEVR